MLENRKRRVAIESRLTGLSFATVAESAKVPADHTNRQRT